MSAKQPREPKHAPPRGVGSSFAASKGAAARFAPGLPPVFQQRSAVSSPGDFLEREADRVAQAIAPVAASVAAAAPPTDPPGVPMPPGGGQPLPASVRAQFEPRLGFDFGGVHVHTGAQAARSAAALQARSFTFGSDIVFGRAEYAPETAAGRHLLAHELVHVAQQGHATRIGPSPITVAAAARPTIFRAVVPSPIARRTSTQIFGTSNVAPNDGISLADFKSYTDAQIDWFAEPTLDPADRNDLWFLLLLLEEGPHIERGLGDIKVRFLRQATRLPGDWDPLRAYCRGSHSSQRTLRIRNPTANPLGERIELGRTLVALEAVVPPAVLEVTVSDVQLAYLRAHPPVMALLTQYFSEYQPHLEWIYDPNTVGSIGIEFQHVIDFLNTAGAAGYAALAPLRGATPQLRWVRNLHRFPLLMLQRLVANLAAPSTTITGPNPPQLILVIHSGHDTSSFQLSAWLFDSLVRSSPHNFVLMIEAPTSLADVTARLPGIAATYGHRDLLGNRKINQVVIAGHGSERTIQLAEAPGAPNVNPNTRHVEYPGEGLAVGAPATAALINALYANLDPDTARILFAGCLVGATRIPQATPAAGMGAAMAANESLGHYTQSLAPVAFSPGAVQAARASVGLGAAGTSLFNPVTGSLSPQLGQDPLAFGPANIYAKKGVEPEGLLRAAVEIGVTVNAVTAADALRARLAMAATASWYDRWARIAADLALNGVPPGGPLDLVRANHLANVISYPFLSFWPQNFGISVGHFMWPVPPNTTALNGEPFAADIYARMAATSEYTSAATNDTKQMRLIIDQAWMAQAGNGREAPFLASIATVGLEANHIAPLLNTFALTATPGRGGRLLPPGAPTSASIRLALAWFRVQPANADVGAFLSAQVTTGGAVPAFTPAVHAAVQASAGTEPEILRALGFGATATTIVPGIGGLPPTVNVAANAPIAGSAQNVQLVTAHPHNATVPPGGANARGAPNLAAPVLHALLPGQVVHVMGRTASGWSAVDFGGRLGYVHPAIVL